METRILDEAETKGKHKPSNDKNERVVLPEKALLCVKIDVDFSALENLSRIGSICFIRRDTRCYSEEAKRKQQKQNDEEDGKNKRKELRERETVQLS